MASDNADARLLVYSKLNGDGVVRKYDPCLKGLQGNKTDARRFTGLMRKFAPRKF